MKIAAIIAEYNPLHTGHLYHIRQTKLDTNCDALIAVMSGSFVQRGEPAIIDKYLRAKSAVLCGIDLVIELPVVYSLQSAEGFARGAVEILKRCGIVDILSFGSESGSIEDILTTSELINENPIEYATALREQLSFGYSYAAASASAISKLSNYSPGVRIMKSNDLLALEYLKAIGSGRIVPFSVKRDSVHLSESFPSRGAASASAIRSAILSSEFDIESLAKYLPDPSAEALASFYSNRRNFGCLDNFTSLFNYLLFVDKKKMSGINRYENGFEYLLNKSATDTDTLSETVKNAVSRRYKKSRIKRFVLNYILNITEDVVEEAMCFNGLYVRPLAFNETGAAVLNSINKHGDIPVISKFSDAYYKNLKLRTMLDLELAASNLYELQFQNSNFNYDFLKSPITIKKEQL